jgi:ribonuclease-3
MNLMSEKVILDELSTKLGYRFKKAELLMQAFRHASYVNEQGDANLEDNERLEFLGDAVLDLAISHLLMEFFKDSEEGVLSKYRAMVVDKAGLYEMALKLNLGDYLLLGRGEEQSHGREKPSILANTTEALIGALYLDSGFDNTMEIVGRLFSSLLDKIATKETVYDFKSSLQEHTQQTYKALPEYSLVEEFGPAHDKTFKVVLVLSGVILAEGIGKSKKEAEQNAAKEAFFCLKEDPNI